MSFFSTPTNSHKLPQTNKQTDPSPHSSSPPPSKAQAPSTPSPHPKKLTLNSAINHACCLLFTSSPISISPIAAQITTTIASMGLRHEGTHPAAGDSCSVHLLLAVWMKAETGLEGAVGVWEMRRRPPSGCGAVST